MPDSVGIGHVEIGTVTPDILRCEELRVRANAVRKSPTEVCARDRDHFPCSKRDSSNDSSDIIGNIQIHAIAPKAMHVSKGSAGADSIRTATDSRTCKNCGDVIRIHLVNDGAVRNVQVLAVTPNVCWFCEGRRDGRGLACRDCDASQCSLRLVHDVEVRAISPNAHRILQRNRCATGCQRCIRHLSCCYGYFLDRLMRNAVHKRLIRPKAPPEVNRIGRNPFIWRIGRGKPRRRRHRA